MSTVWFEPVYIHAVVLAIFSSLIAPFGGFFASGLKRAFRIKVDDTTYHCFVSLENEK